MGVDGWILVGRLKRAVKKIKFLLDFKVNRLKLASIVGKRRLSFNSRPGLMACVEDRDQAGSNSSGRLSFRRTISYPSESDHDDIDKKADAFIANFHKQLKVERQISLELRYYRGNSFSDYARSPS